jgi:hypothetical protein
VSDRTAHVRRPPAAPDAPVGRCGNQPAGYLQFLNRAAAKAAGKRATPSPMAYRCDTCSYWHWARRAA